MLLTAVNKVISSVVMTDRETPSDFVGQRIKDLRKRRGWSLEGLADRCAELGAGQITEHVIENIEHGRRDRRSGRRRRAVTVDELLIFAYALDVAPVHLLVPTQETRYPYVPQEPISDEHGVYPAGISSRVRQWIRGKEPMPGTDLRIYYSEVPADEFHAQEDR
jgi:transcriptional regulator with XRE-family HTH domain